MTCAVVTGAGGGIGGAVARRLAAEGRHVVLVDRDPEGLARVRAQIAAAGASAEAAELDVTDSAAVDELCDELAGRHGGIAVACNAAGVTGVRAPFADYPERVLRRVIEVNAIGTFVCMRAQLRHMAAGGAIVNVASGSAQLGAARAAAYTASKHAVAGLTRTAAIDHADRGVRVNAVAPGLVLTGGVELDDADAFVAAHPIGRPARAEEIAAAVCWLLGADAAYLTGAVVPVDGGLTAGVAGLR